MSGWRSNYKPPRRPMDMISCPDCGAFSGYVTWDGKTKLRCQSCSEVNRRARSTLTLLSRVAVFMWMEARAQMDSREDLVGVNIHDWRDCTLRRAIERGLLRVDWGRP